MMIALINQSILTQVLFALREGNIRYCEALGFTSEELNKLNQLSMGELFCLSRSAAQFLSVTINHDVLQRMMLQAGQEMQLQQRVERALILGGSIELLRHYFGMSSGEVSARRRVMGLHIPQGRTQIPGEEDDNQIWVAWQTKKPGNIDTLEALDAMMDIVDQLSGKEASPSLTVVWNRIQLWENDADLNT